MSKSLTSVEDAAQAIRDCGLDLDAVVDIVADALAEDLGGRGVLLPGTGAGVDVTSHATIDADAVSVGDFVARAPGVVAGLAVAAYAVAVVCAPAGDLSIEIHAVDGQVVQRGDLLLTVTGNTRSLLTAERVALNLLTLMSGTATATSRWVDALRGSSTQVRDSRKTIPGLRMLQKYAVRVAGGVNHRMSLADAALIKDNHVIAAGGVVEAYQAVVRAFPDIHIQVEVTTEEQAIAVAGAGATEILLDNMSPEQMSRIVLRLSSTVKLEASGGLTLQDAATVAATGVDYVAVGAITHSAQILDIALDFRAQD